jgi:hypothetical protein
MPPDHRPDLRLAAGFGVVVVAATVGPAADRPQRAHGDVGSEVSCRSRTPSARQALNALADLHRAVGER